MRIVTFKVPEYLLELLDWCAAVEGLTRSEVIRRAVEAYLKGRQTPYRRIRVRRVVLT